jgi:hypothetical protein
VDEGVDKGDGEGEDGGKSEGGGERRSKRVQRTGVHEGCPVLFDVREGQPAALDPQRPHSRLAKLGLGLRLHLQLQALGAQGKGKGQGGGGVGRRARASMDGGQARLPQPYRVVTVATLPAATLPACPAVAAAVSGELKEADSAAAAAVLVRGHEVEGAAVRHGARILLEPRQGRGAWGLGLVGFGWGRRLAVGGCGLGVGMESGTGFGGGAPL